jgi:uncharacterized repeat protein (TIGR01451 family)
MIGLRRLISLPVALSLVLVSAIYYPLAVQAGDPEDVPSSKSGWIGVTGEQASPRAFLSPGINGTGSGKVYYSDCNSYDSATPFYEYDVATDTWSQRASLPGENFTQLASDAQGNVYSLPFDNRIYRYNPGPDSWSFVINGPPSFNPQSNINMFKVHGDQFYVGGDGTGALHYTVGGVWNSITTPRAISSGAAVDRSTGRIYIRTWGELGFFVFDPVSASFPLVIDDPTNVYENSRVGAFYNGEFFSRTQTGAYQAYNLATSLWRNTGIAPTSSHSATGEDQAGNIYSNGWEDANVFEVFNVPANTLLRLADAPVIPGNTHSTLVWSGTGAPVIVATKTAARTKDADGDGATSPGDTIKYTVVIKNDGQGPATGVIFSDTPDINTRLVVGSVTATQGLITQGNTAGDTVEVNIGEITANSQVTITFDVTINKPIWVNQVANQGIVEGANFSGLKTDDAATAQPDDPTVTRIKMSLPVQSPGVSEWSTGALALLLGSATLWLVRRRRVRNETN